MTERDNSPALVELPPLVQTPAGWLSFDGPGLTLAAAAIGDVLPLLRRVEEAVAAGAWAVGYLAYEAAPAFEPALRCHRPGPLPVVWFRLFERPPIELTEPPAAVGPEPVVGPLTPSVERAGYDRAIATIHERIAAGETYQVNYTFHWRGPFAGSAYGLANRLWAGQRGSWGAWLDAGEWAVASASPELFWSLEGERVVSRPMKGTARRGRTLAEDRDRAAALRASLKDQAENLMIVDMVRNDLGRVAELGSVTVEELFCLERYEQVWQLTSAVAARTTASLTELLAATFPCASITGAPKVRTMALIRELEPEPRGVYTGAIGWLGPGRRGAFNVAIRTAVVDRRAGEVSFGVGGGIVWDSTAAGEWDECRAKALVLTCPRPAFELLETLLWEPGRGYFLADRHLARLAASADYFGFACDLAAVRVALPAVWPGLHRVRLRLARSGAVTIEGTPLPTTPPRPWRVGLAAEPVDSRDPFLYHKTTRREVYDRARAARPEWDDVLLFNERGEITESCLANVAALLDGRLVTPPLDCGLLPGIYRELALERGWLTERVLRVEDLERCDGLWLCNSVRRWIEVDWQGVVE